MTSKDYQTKVKMNSVLIQILWINSLVLFIFKRYSTFANILRKSIKENFSAKKFLLLRLSSLSVLNHKQKKKFLAEQKKIVNKSKIP